VGLREVIVAWLDSHFQLLEHSAPWLSRIGAEVYDHCSGGVSPRLSRNFMATSRSSRASAQCHRQVTVVYGFDGAPATRLGSLAEALSAAGWERYGPNAEQPWTADLDGLARLRWRPSAALSHPPGLAETPPWGGHRLSPLMQLLWSDREQDSEWRPNPPRRRWRATRDHLPVEISEAEASSLLSEALERHQHVLAVTMDLSYYANVKALSRPHRLPRYLFPTPQAGGHSGE
jgi:hypothetical protein